jgi:FdhD protein
MSNNSVTKQAIRRVQQGKLADVEDVLATEEPLEIRLIYGPTRTHKNLAVTMRTPGNDEELATGFLYTEGVISKQVDITSCKQLNGNVMQVELDKSIALDLKNIDRNFYTTSSCGVCGKASIDAIKTECAIYDKAKPFTVSAETIYALPEKLRGHQATFEETGGIHAAALFDLAGNIIMVREDVGRHNALDKLIGAALNQGMIPLQQHILLLSGRASFELVQKATMAGLKVIVSVGAPSSLAVQTADEFGITLVGFAKRDKFNIYCNGEIITI